VRANEKGRVSTGVIPLWCLSVALFVRFLTGAFFCCRPACKPVLAIIFGAGASYDSLPTYPLFPGLADPVSSARLPLANELFENRGEFAAARGMFRRLHGIIPYLQRTLVPLNSSPEAKSVEEVLEDLQSCEPNYRPVRQREMAAVRFYLQTIISKCETAVANAAQGVTNHRTLLDLVEEYRKGADPVCLITFNYDRMLEKALTAAVGFSITGPMGYVNKPSYKLFKLHGSIDWGHPITRNRPSGSRDNNVSMNDIIEQSDDFEYSDEIYIADSSPAYLDKYGAPLFPAVGVPTQTKTRFECPPEHIPVLKSALPQITKLLIIGWRAQERHFLDLFSPVLRQNQLREIAIVSGTEKGAQETRKQFQQEGFVGRFDLFGSGFSRFIVEGAARGFFRSPW
jgi:hypothetical protein